MSAAQLRLSGEAGVTLAAGPGDHTAPWGQLPWGMKNQCLSVLMATRLETINKYKELKCPSMKR